MNNNGKSALLQAMEGKDLGERQSQSALGEAMKQITNLTKRVSTNKETLAETGTNLVHTAETMGTVFMASMAEGYLGPEKLKIGGMDLRAPLGIAAQGYGLYEIMNGRDGGGHALALGNGLTGSWLAHVGRQAGEAVRENGERKDKSKGKAEAPAQEQPQAQPAAQPQAQAQPQPAPAQEPSTGARLLPAPPAEEVGVWPRAAEERVHVERRPVREVLLTPPSRRGAPHGADPFEAQPPRQRAGARRDADSPQPDQRRGPQDHGRTGRFVRAGSDDR